MLIGANPSIFVVQMYACEEANSHSGAFVFLIGQLLSSIPFLFLISISSSLAFYFLIGLRDEFSLLMYFTLNFFTCLLVNEGLLLTVAAFQLDVFWSILTLIIVHVSSNFLSLAIKQLPACRSNHPNFSVVYFYVLFSP